MNAEESYRILGIASGTSPKEVQAAYRKKALEFHPDRAGSAEQSEYFHKRFLEIRDAYEHLRREGFPVPEPEEVVDMPRDWSGWTAGRSFAPKEPAERESFTKQMGFEFKIDLGSAFLWCFLIPAGGIGAFYFIRWVLAMIRAQSGGGGDAF